MQAKSEEEEACPAAVAKMQSWIVSDCNARENMSVNETKPQVSDLASFSASCIDEESENSSPNQQPKSPSTPPNISNTVRQKPIYARDVNSKALVASAVRNSCPGSLRLDDSSHMKLAFSSYQRDRFLSHQSEGKMRGSGSETGCATLTPACQNSMKGISVSAAAGR
jgi:hypothetical protein